MDYTNGYIIRFNDGTYWCGSGNRFSTDLRRVKIYVTPSDATLAAQAILRNISAAGISSPDEVHKRPSTFNVCEIRLNVVSVVR